MAYAKQKVAGEMTFHSAMPRTQNLFLTNARRDSSAQMKKINVFHCLLWEVLANSIATASLPVHSSYVTNLSIDQCEGPPNFRELSDDTGRGLNVNGSVCLNDTCMWANVTLGTECVVENTPYIAYGFDGEFVNIVSRDNCHIGLYCDASQKICMNAKNVGDSCTADKECQSWNCLASGVCGETAATPHHFSVHVYVFVALGIFGGMFGTLTGLFFMHRKQREEEREKRVQYWREQNTFHQNLLQMRETARASIRSLPGNAGSARSTMYSRDAVSDMHAPIVQNASTPKGSGLRHYLADNGSSESEDGITTQITVDRHF
ncbi:hypothetical protein AX17_003082 [Amanita inopinata Kibby_2008]|nr:hypothetical protein AX17_003082 [Amanita inopinata Kibby_2008]